MAGSRRFSSRPVDENSRVPRWALPRGTLEVGDRCSRATGRCDHSRISAISIRAMIRHGFAVGCSYSKKKASFLQRNTTGEAALTQPACVFVMYTAMCTRPGTGVREFDVRFRGKGKEGQVKSSQEPRVRVTSRGAWRQRAAQCIGQVMPT